jgi:hypothetical protein
VEGEIYDDHTSAEDIINSYIFNYKDYDNADAHFFIEAKHNDIRGKIIKMTRLPIVHKYKGSNKELFLS